MPGCFLISTPDICFDAKDGYSYCWCRYVTIIIIHIVLFAIIISVIFIITTSIIIGIIIMIMIAAQRTYATAVPP